MRLLYNPGENRGLLLAQIPVMFYGIIQAHYAHQYKNGDNAPLASQPVKRPFEAAKTQLCCSATELKITVNGETKTYGRYNGRPYHLAPGWGIGLLFGSFVHQLQD